MILHLSSPLEVPSAYFLTDCWLMVDKYLGNKLLCSQSGEDSRVKLAGLEGVKLKRLISALRGLWRSSPKGGADERIVELKSYLRQSPTRRGAADSSDEDDGGRGALNDAGEDNDDSDTHAEIDNGHNAIVEHTDRVPDIHPASTDDEDEDSEDSEIFSDGDKEGAPGDNPAHEEVNSSQDSLRAPTIRLGQEPGRDDSPDEVPAEELPDSQVSSGWLGKAYMYYNAMDREMEKQEGAVQRLLDDIRRDLESQMETTLDDVPLWGEYRKWCRNQLHSYGDQVYHQLASFDNFSFWISEKMEEDSL